MIDFIDQSIIWTWNNQCDFFHKK